MVPRIGACLTGLVAIASVLASLAFLDACGSDDEAPVEPVDAGTDDALDEPPTSTKGDGGGDPGVVVIEVDCPVGTAVEIEDNNTPPKANDLDTSLSFCGTLSTAADVDYSKFTTPTGKKLALFQAVIDGKVDFDLTVNGKTLQPGEVKMFEAGEYLIKAYTKDSKPAKYRYRIQFEP